MGCQFLMLWSHPVVCHLLMLSSDLTVCQLLMLSSHPVVCQLLMLSSHLVVCQLLMLSSHLEEHLCDFRREDGGPGKPGSSKSGGPTSPSGPGAMPDSSRAPQKKKEPPPVPAKTYSLKEVGMDVEEVKARNYENSNRSVIRAFLVLIFQFYIYIFILCYKGFFSQRWLLGDSAKLVCKSE